MVAQTTVAREYAPVGAPPLARRALGTALLVLGAGLASNSLLGPLLTGVVHYRFSASTYNQLLGLEAVSLLLVAPLCVVAGILALRRHPAAPVLGIGPATYATYMLAQYVVGPGYLRYPRVLPFHLALFVLGVVTTALAWSAADPPVRSGRSARRWSWLAAGLAAFVFSRYVPMLAGSWSGHALAAESTREPAMFWSIVLLDLGLVVPAALATAYGLRARTAWSARALYGLVGWFALVPPSVAAMGVAMLVNHDPNASVPTTVLLASAAAVFAVVAVRLYRPLFVTHRGDRPHATPPARYQPEAVIRPLGPDDMERLRAFHSRLSPDTVYSRFFYLHEELSDAEVVRFTHVDQRDRVALAATLGDDLVGVARFDRIPGTSSAELACVVEDRWQDHGIGTRLMALLVDRARAEGITHLVGEILATNGRMLALVHHAGIQYDDQRDGGYVTTDLTLAPSPA
jgi:GNAT superfamily N-acetyltransferase